MAHKQRLIKAELPLGTLGRKFIKNMLLVFSSFTCVFQTTKKAVGSMTMEKGLVLLLLLQMIRPRLNFALH